MQSVSTRINSFAPPSPPKSTRTRRAATPKLSWPHPDSFLANPTSLAEAGFYYLPSEDDPDNVACFMCDKQLSDWEPEDDPLQLHVEKCPACPWVMVKCQILYYKDVKTRPDSFASPNSSNMDKARLETFGKGRQRWWPHDQVKNHGALSKHMAKAGFVYTPTNDPEDDTATCFYCGTILSGWEINDDPLEEHSRRKVAAACPFILSTKSSSATRKAPKAVEPVRQETNEPEAIDSAEKLTKKKRRNKTEITTVAQPVEEIELTTEDPPKRSTRHQSKSRITTQAKENVPSQQHTAKQLPPRSRRKIKRSESPPEVTEATIVQSAEEMDLAPEAEIAPKRLTRHWSKSRAANQPREGIIVQEEVEEVVSQANTVKLTTAKSKKKKKKKNDPPPEHLEEERIETLPNIQSVVLTRQQSETLEEKRSEIEPVDTAIPIDHELGSNHHGQIQADTPKLNFTSRAALDTAIPQQDVLREEEVVMESEPDYAKLEHFFPALAAPRPLMEGRKVEIPHLSSEERAMTVEEWIRAEMQKQCDALRLDGETAIKGFQLQAQEIRRRIIAL